MRSERTPFCVGRARGDEFDLETRGPYVLTVYDCGSEIDRVECATFSALLQQYAEARLNYETRWHHFTVHNARLCGVDHTLPGVPVTDSGLTALERQLIDRIDERLAARGVADVS